jgi:hypothetical protein
VEQSNIDKHVFWPKNRVMRRLVTFLVSRSIPLAPLSPAALFGQSSFPIITPGKTTPLRPVRTARFSRRRILLISLLVVLSVPSQVRGQDTHPQTQIPAPNDASKKIWTNENISSTHGNISVVGGGASRVSATGQDFELASHGATFVNPKPGQVVHPGEALHVDIAIDSGVTLLRGAGIMSSVGAFSEIRQAPPYSFTFMVPKEVRGGDQLIGLQRLYALGPVVGRANDPNLAMTTIDVEEPDLPLSLTAAGGMMPNNGSALTFLKAGDAEQISIYARFPDGQELNVTKSSYLELTSSDVSVVRIADEGTVVSVGAGNASIIASYTLQGQEKRLPIPVSVSSERGFLTASPATVDFGDIPVGTTTPPRQVTITNNSSGDVKIYGVNYTIGPENCSNRVLAPGGSCSLTVSMSLNSIGRAHVTILVDSLSIVLLANGI